MITTALAIVAGLLGAAMGVPQLRVIARSSVAETQGVSVTTWATIAASCSSFTIYGFTNHSYAIILGNALSLLFGVWVTVRLLHLRGKSVAGWVVLWAALGLFALATRSTPAIAGWIGTAFAVVQRHPQIVASLRSARSPSARAIGSGVSLEAWWLSAVCNGIWVIYALLAHDSIILVANIVMVLQSVTVICVEILGPDPDDDLTPPTKSPSTNPAKVTHCA